MAINDWPSSERPREKLILKGPQALSNAELLAIFLRTGCQGCSALDLARELLNHFGGLRQLWQADIEAFTEVKGVGEAKYAQFQAVLELARRHMEESLEHGVSFSEPNAVREYLASLLRERPHEVFVCLFLDTRHRLICSEELFQGSIDSAHVHPRVVVSRALELKAAALILAHNHPSGIAEPSQADKSLTQRLTDALRLIDVRVLDHFIVGEGTPYSFAEHGHL